MASAGTVTLELDANSVKMIRELQKAQNHTRRSARSMQNDMRKAFTRISRAANLMAAGLAAATAAIVRSQSRAIDDLAKTADALGVTTQNLQALQFAAELTGTSANQLATNMERMQRRLGEVARGGGTAAKALEEIGVNIRDIQNLSADQQMEVLAQALAGVENAAIRASIANDLFGRDGVRMLKLMDELARTGIGGVRDELRALGVDISREGAAKVEMMNDSLLRLRQIGQGAAQTLTIQLAPVVAAIATELTDAARASGGFRDQVVQGMELAARGVGVLADGLRGIQALYAAITLGAAKYVETFLRGLVAIDNALARFSGGDLEERILGPREDGRGTFLQEVLTSVENAAKDIAAGFEDIMNRELPSDIVARRFAEIRAEADAEAAQIASRGAGQTPMQLGEIVLSDNVAAHHKRIVDEMRRDAARMWQGTRTDVENYTAAVQRAIDLLNRGLITEDTFDRYVSQLAEAMQGTEEALSEISEFGRQAARNLQSHFADFLFDPFKDGLSGMLRGFRDTLRRMVAEAASQQILGALFGGLAGSSNAFLSALGGAFGGARAMGGPVSSGKAYLVGERGPELFVPGSSGQIVPNGATSVTVNIDARQSDDPGRILSLVPLIQNQIEQSMELKMRRGLI